MGSEKLKESSGNEDSGYRPIVVSEARVLNFVGQLAKLKDLASIKQRAALEQLRESTTDFPLLLGGVLNKMMAASYDVADRNWRQYIKTATEADFRQYEIYKKWGYAALKQIPEFGEYEGFPRAEGKYYGRLKKFGRKYGISWEMLINDNLGGFNDISELLADMALNSEMEEATGLFCSASGPNASLIGATVTDAADSCAITNKGSLPLNVTNLEITIGLMVSQKDKNGNPLKIVPRYLVVPPKLEMTALNILNSATVLQIGGGSSSSLRGVNNVIPTKNLVLVVNDWLPIIDVSGKGDATWYLFSDQKVPCCRMTFLQGYERPQLAIKASDIQGGSGMTGSFDNDTIEYRVRHIMNGDILDPRGVYAQTGS